MYQDYNSKKVIEEDLKKFLPTFTKAYTKFTKDSVNFSGSMKFGLAPMQGNPGAEIEITPTTITIKLTRVQTVQDASQASPQALESNDQRQTIQGKGMTFEEARAMFEKNMRRGSEPVQKLDAQPEPKKTRKKTVRLEEPKPTEASLEDFDPYAEDETGSGIELEVLNGPI